VSACHNFRLAKLDDDFQSFLLLLKCATFFRAAGAKEKNMQRLISNQHQWRSQKFALSVANQNQFVYKTSLYQAFTDEVKKNSFLSST
jgi:hypothetical protein